MAEIEEPEGSFKVPNVSEMKTPLESQVAVISNEAESKSKIVSKKSPKSSNSNITLPYTEPEWSGSPPLLYSFEIIKNGTPVSTLKIVSSLIVFGRLDVCDVIFEHPSVSRFHAVIQYCKGDDLHQKGFYLYDLGSTHGTYLNKDRVKPKIYYKLKVGYVLKFGGSTRLHIFQGPEEEEQIDVKCDATSNEDVEICNWGMGEDAEEDEDISENPFALSTPNEELYLEDPKKTLRGWFEREGYDLEYNVEEKGFKTFMCRVQLPVDNPTGDFLPVEASVSGKKKEAVVACALEACRTLDRLGLLRQSHQESRQRKKKKWEENDYYDSDEDTFLDRTGTIEKKRELRKKMEKKSEVETYQSLETKLKIIMEEIGEIKRKLSVPSSDLPPTPNSEEDSLEIYMSSLGNSESASDKIERSKLKFRLSEAEKEKTHLEKLLDIARPVKLPPIVKYPGIIGKKLKCKLHLSIPKSDESIKYTTKLKENENIEENDSDSDTGVVEEGKVNNSNKCENIVGSNQKCSTMGHTEESEYVVSVNPGGDLIEKGDSKSYGLIMPKSEIQKGNITNIISKDVTESINEVSTGCESGMDPSSKKSSCEISAIMIDEQQITLKTKKAPEAISKKRFKKKDELKESDVYMTDKNNYSTWVPPSGQSGDGITHLNAKYGY